jgi:hypothetical protein
MPGPTCLVISPLCRIGASEPQKSCGSAANKAGMTRRPCCRDSGWSLKCAADGRFIDTSHAKGVGRDRGSKNGGIFKRQWAENLFAEKCPWKFFAQLVVLV